MSVDEHVRESAREKAKRRWSNYEIERKFKENRKASADAPATPAAPQIADTVESDEFQRAKFEKRAEKISKKVLEPVIDKLKERYESTIRAQHGLISKLVIDGDPERAYKRMLVQKLKLLQELDRRRNMF